MAYTIASLATEARAMLQDVIGTSGQPVRFSNQDLVDAFNDALVQARTKRPDLFLAMGLRNTVPQYGTGDITAATPTPFPLDASVYPAFLYYIVGRCEMRNDTYADNGRAVAMLSKFVSQLMQVAS